MLGKVKSVICWILNYFLSFLYFNAMFRFGLWEAYGTVTTAHVYPAKSKGVSYSRWTLLYIQQTEKEI